MKQQLNGRFSQKVCILTSQYPPTVGGLGHSAHRIANMLANYGFKTHVVVFQKNARPLPFDECMTTAQEGPITVHRAKIYHPDWRTAREADGRLMAESAVLTRYNREIFDLLDHLQHEYEFDLLHSFFLYPAGFVATAVAKYHGIKSIVSIRGNDVGKYIFDPLRSGFILSALRQADYITSVATSLLELADGLAGPLRHKSRTILNSINLETAVPKTTPDLPLKKLVIGTAGLFRYKKGLIYLLKAAARLKDDVDFTLLLAGDFFSPAEEVLHMQYLEELGLTDRVVITGKVPHSDMLDYLQLFDILVLPSLFAEGCPLTLLEAMAVQCPVIASRSGAIPEIIRHGESGHLIQPGSSDAIYEALVQLVEDTAYRQRLAEGAYQRAQELTPAGALQEWLDVYREVFGEDSRPRENDSRLVTASSK